MGLAKGFKLALMAGVSISVFSIDANAQQTQYDWKDKLDPHHFEFKVWLFF